MNTASELQMVVQDELAWEPSLDAAAIGVGVTGDGVVTLTGHVDSYTEKLRAEKAAKRVLGVHAVANDLTVKLPGLARRDDTDIAEAVQSTLRWHTLIPHDHIQATVKSGWVTLEGEVDWQFQRESAEGAVEHLRGVRGVTNLVSVRPKVRAEQIERRIESALQRSASLDARKVHVETTADGKVILRGTVRSWAEREDAERAAWSAPGVREVDSHVTLGAMEMATV